MRKQIIAVMTIGFVFVGAQTGFCGPLGWLKSKIPQNKSSKLSDTKINQGLKEALSVGIENTISITGKENGFLNNEKIKILLPENIRKVETFLRSAGFGPQVDEFMLSMNRAAEHAAPLAADVFSGSLTDMNFTDVSAILHGGNTAATEYFKTKTYDKLLTGFTPMVSKSMQGYGVTKKFEDIMAKVKTIPFAKDYMTLDIDKYVASKALDGIFSVMSSEEAKIRTDPQARVTKLLQEVFK